MSSISCVVATFGSDISLTLGKLFPSVSSIPSGRRELQYESFPRENDPNVPLGTLDSRALLLAVTQY